MRPVRVAVVVAFLLCPTTLPAQQSDQFGVSDSAAIKQLFNRYNQAFSKKDYRQLRDELQAPFLRFTAGVESLPTLDDVIEFYETLREPLDEQGYDHSELVDSRITALGIGTTATVQRHRGRTWGGRGCRAITWAISLRSTTSVRAWNRR